MQPLETNSEEKGLLQAEQLEASARPSRLPLIAHVIVVGALAASFLSGIALWYGQSISAEGLEQPAWMHRCRVLHGSLNPLLCGLFGYLCAQHIRYGWLLRANWVSGLVMEAVFLVLIVTALGSYYAAEGWFRDMAVLIHRVAGAALPVVLLGHWVAARQWIKKI